MPLVALCRRHFSADFITNISEFDFRQAQDVPTSVGLGFKEWGTSSHTTMTSVTAALNR